MGGFFKQYVWIVDLVGILLCSFFLSKIVGVYLGSAFEVKRSVGVLKPVAVLPPETRQVDINEYSIINTRNIFDFSAGQGAAGAEEAVGSAEETIPTGEAVKTNLNIKVIGVLVVGDGRDRRSTATIVGGGAAPISKESDKKAKAAGGGGSAAVYAVGDDESFAPNTRLTRVQPDRIEFVNNGRLEFAEVSTEFGEGIFGPPKREAVAEKETTSKAQQTSLVQKEGPGKFTVDQREIDEAIQNLDKLYTDIRAVPNFQGGKVSGMKILSVRGDSLFAKLGLRRGDVLQKINGIELDVKRGFEIFNQLKDQKNLTLDLIRQGQPTTLEYEIR